MKEKTMNEWLMLLKTVPDNVFIEFFSDNPEMRYVAEDYEVVKSNEKLKSDARKLIRDWASKPENAVKILEMMSKP